MRTRSSVLFIATLVALSYATHGVADETFTVRDLGEKLTPLGGLRTANADGSIPEWRGGVTTAPAEYRVGAFHPDPFADDKILFTINAQNLEQYQAKLSPGQVAMLRQYPSFKMNVYPSHRSAAAPNRIYEATKANPTRARLTEDGNGVTGTVAGIPFPLPANGLEAIWNHILRYRGEAATRMPGQAAVMTDGSYTLLRYEDEFLFVYNHADTTTNTLNNKIFYFMQEISSPARLAGRILVTHETIDANKEPRNVWVYNPGQRRVRRAPEVSYDSPPPGTDALRTVDQFDMFNGSPDRYQWELVGRKEMIVPYNSYRLHSDKLKYRDIIRPLHLNPEHARYELHRVWQVEAKLKPGMRHIYARRTFYIDEDSWQVLAIDQYDERGAIWRVSEAHPIVFYEVPVFVPTLEVHYDLQSRRYLVFGLDNEDRVPDYSIKRTAADYNPDALRRVGKR